MRKVEIEIDENYADCLSITVAGHKYNELRIATCAVDLRACDKLIVNSNGTIEQRKKV